MMRRATAAALAALLVGCAASGVRVTDEQIARLTPRVTTLADTERALGPATTRMRMPDGSMQLHYIYSEASVRAASLIPVVGLLAGGTDVRSSMVVLRYDAAGVLVDVMSSASQYGTGVGASSGAVDRSAVPQPRQ